MFRVQHNTTKEIFLMQEATNGIRLYSTVDHSGEGDKTISTEEFKNNFTILEKLED